jgi:hypothetical protein
VLSRARTLEAQDGSLKALEAELSRVKQVFDVGRAATVDVLRVEASIAAARAERVRLASSLDLAQRNLARLAGVETEETRASNLVPVALIDVSLPSREDPSAFNQAQRCLPARARRQRGPLDRNRSRRLPSVNLDEAIHQLRKARSGANSLEWNVRSPSPHASSIGRRFGRRRALAIGGAKRLGKTEVDGARGGARNRSRLSRGEAEALRV